MRSYRLRELGARSHYWTQGHHFFCYTLNAPRKRVNCYKTLS